MGASRNPGSSPNRRLSSGRTSPMRDDVVWPCSSFVLYLAVPAPIGPAGEAATGRGTRSSDGRAAHRAFGRYEQREDTMAGGFGDVVVMLPGLIGSVLCKDGEPLWGTSPGALWGLVAGRTSNASPFRARTTARTTSATASRRRRSSRTPRSFRVFGSRVGIPSVHRPRHAAGADAGRELFRVPV